MSDHGFVTSIFSVAFALTVSFATPADADVLGITKDFRSPGGLTESCVALTHIPGGQYSQKDVESEQKFCAIDFYANDVALCAKTWSTSPGTMIYSTDGMGQADYESQHCAGKSGHTKLAKFKSTMNAQGTSSTFSTSSLLYYHFSRFFDTRLDVPAAVYRTIDKDQHFTRVSSGAQGLSKMNQTAWSIMRMAEQNPSSYVPTDELFTADRRQIYGILLKDKGTGYGAEVEGTEVDPWGVGQNNDFQQTPGFLALRSAQPLAQAIREGTELALQDPLMHKAVGDSLNSVQVVYWMKEISEITLLDYIFSQQDRIMNIDFTWEWVYADASGQVKSSKVKDNRFEKLSRARMTKIPVPAEIAAFKPILLQHSAINDNDSGGRTQYTNFTKKTQMLEKIRHYSAGTYRKLVQLNKDFQSKGTLYLYAAKTFGLTSSQLAQLVSNTKAALGILQATCQAGQMRFDVEPKAFLLGQPTETHVDCVNP